MGYVVVGYQGRFLLEYGTYEDDGTRHYFYWTTKPALATLVGFVEGANLLEQIRRHQPESCAYLVPSDRVLIIP